MIEAHIIDLGVDVCGQARGHIAVPSSQLGARLQPERLNAIVAMRLKPVRRVALLAIEDAADVDVVHVQRRVADRLAGRAYGLSMVLGDLAALVEQAGQLHGDGRELAGEAVKGAGDDGAEVVLDAGVHGAPEDAVLKLRRVERPLSSNAPVLAIAGSELSLQLPLARPRGERGQAGCARGARRMQPVARISPVRAASARVRAVGKVVVPCPVRGTAYMTPLPLVIG